MRLPCLHACFRKRTPSLLLVLISMSAFDLYLHYSERVYVPDVTVVTKDTGNVLTGCTEPRKNTSGEASSPFCSQSKRIEILKEACERRNWRLGTGDIARKFNRILVDDKHKLLYCGANKGGSTAWLRLLAYASGKVEQGAIVHVHNKTVMDQYGLRRLISYKKAGEIQHRLDNYFKFIVVRHPVERIVSAWYDKMILPDGHLVSLGKELANTYKQDRNSRQNETDPGFWKDHAFFNEFMRYLAKSHLMDQHWHSFESVCSPCAVKWDAIIKLETTDHDSEIVLKRLGDDINMKTVPIVHSNSDKNKLNHFSKRLPELNDMRPEALAYLHNLYDNDLAMFGYNWDQESLTATCGAPDQGVCC